MDSDESELKGAIAEARKVGLSERVIDKAKETLQQKARARISKYLQDATELQEEDQLRDAIAEARKGEVSTEEVEAAQAVLTRLILDRQVADLRLATQGNEAELREAIREARRQELPPTEIDTAQEALASMVLAKKLTWLRNASETRDESELRNVLSELRKMELPSDESLRMDIQDQIADGQSKLTQIILDRELEHVEEAMSSGNETQLRKAIEQAREASVLPQDLEPAIETLSQLTSERLRRKLQTMVDCEDEEEVREVLKEARASQISGEELEKARDRLTDLVLVRELTEAYTRTSLRTAIEEAELRQLQHPALDLARPWKPKPLRPHFSAQLLRLPPLPARSRVSAIDRLREAPARHHVTL